MHAFACAGVNVHKQLPSGCMHLHVLVSLRTRTFPVNACICVCQCQRAHAPAQWMHALACASINARTHLRHWYFLGQCRLWCGQQTRCGQWLRLQQLLLYVPAMCGGVLVCKLRCTSRLASWLEAFLCKPCKPCTCVVLQTLLLQVLLLTCEFMYNNMLYAPAMCRVYLCVNCVLLIFEMCGLRFIIFEKCGYCEPTVYTPYMTVYWFPCQKSKNNINTQYRYGSGQP
jgi:hypothetical protein